MNDITMGRFSTDSTRSSISSDDREYIELDELGSGEVNDEIHDLPRELTTKFSLPPEKIIEELQDLDLHRDIHENIVLLLEFIRGHQDFPPTHFQDVSYLTELIHMTLKKKARKQKKLSSDLDEPSCNAGSPLTNTKEEIQEIVQQEISRYYCCSSSCIIL